MGFLCISHSVHFIIRAQHEYCSLWRKESGEKKHFRNDFIIFRLCLQHVEVLGPVIEPAPQQQFKPQQRQHWIVNPLCHLETLEEHIFSPARVENFIIHRAMDRELRYCTKKIYGMKLLHWKKERKVSYQ